MRWTRHQPTGHVPAYVSGDWSLVKIGGSNWGVAFKGEALTLASDNRYSKAGAPVVGKLNDMKYFVGQYCCNGLSDVETPAQHRASFDSTG